MQVEIQSKSQNQIQSQSQSQSPVNNSKSERNMSINHRINKYSKWPIQYGHNRVIIIPYTHCYCYYYYYYDQLTIIMIIDFVVAKKDLSIAARDINGLSSNVLSPHHYYINLNKSRPNKLIYSVLFHFQTKIFFLSVMFYYIYHIYISSHKLFFFIIIDLIVISTQTPV